MMTLSRKMGKDFEMGKKKKKLGIFKWKLDIA